MSIKEKVQQLIQQAEAEKTAELRRQEEARLQLTRLARQREETEAARFEKGKKVIEAIGVQRVLGEVLDVLKDNHPEVKLHFRKTAEDLMPPTPYVIGGFGLFVEGKRESGGKTQLGVALSIDNPNNILVVSANGLMEEEDIILLKDPALLAKIENRLAYHIAKNNYWWEPYELPYFDDDWDPGGPG